jgi:Cu2+-exporting ATPase
MPGGAAGGGCHEAGTAVVTLNAELSDEVLKKTVEDKDYKVMEING